MDWLDALILGLIQGLAEYLPISSSGHLEIFREILGLKISGEDALQFDLILHAATVCSTIVILWPMFKKLCVSFFTFRKDKDFYYVCKILLSCIPVGIVGVFFKDYVKELFGDGLLIVGICLCVTAILLAFAYLYDHGYIRLHSQRGDGNLIPASQGRDITWFDSFIIGCAQAVAVLPGLSRSGTTIATGILLGDKRDKVASFSFLMVIIPILGEALLDVKDMLGESASAESIGALPMIVGFLTAFIVGCCACRWMLELVKKGKLIWFALYCVVMGVICILW
ncbi:MAG: undecaprenyl-diphosphate phosphatase [Muribaculaceae bacterium]|nr:undecaprenyl-diphosphate phosphatase [Muribaculaceae bacterium]